MPVHHVYVLMFELFKQTLNQTKHNQQCADAVAVHVSHVPLLVMLVQVLTFYFVRILSHRRVGGSSSPFECHVQFDLMRRRVSPLERGLIAISSPIVLGGASQRAWYFWPCCTFWTGFSFAVCCIFWILWPFLDE